MGMTTEEILIKVGVDVSELNKLGRTVEGRFQKISVGSQRLAKQQAKTNKMIEKANKNFKDILKTTKPFRMELLSVMFGAGALAGALGALLAPSFEAVDAFGILSDALEVTFLPTALRVQDWALGFFNTITNLNPLIKEGLGDGILWTAGFLALLSFEAQLGLFFDGLTMKVTSLKFAISAIPKAIAITALFSGFNEISEGNILTGATRILTGLGFIVPAGGLRNITLGAALAVSMYETISTGKSKDFVSLLNDALLAGYIGWAIGGPWGAGLGVLATLFVDTVLKKGAVIPSEPFRVNLPQPSQLPAGVQAGPIVPNFAITSNVDVTTQPNIAIDWESILPDIQRQFNETITTQIGNLSRR